MILNYPKLYSFIDIQHVKAYNEGTGIHSKGKES